MDKTKPPRTDAPGYVREPLKVSDNGKFFTVDAAQVVDLMADAKRIRQSGSGEHERSVYPASNHHGEANRLVYGSEGWARGWESEPDVVRVVNGVAARMDRLKALGNGQVPQCAALAWRVLSGT